MKRTQTYETAVVAVVLFLLMVTSTELLSQRTPYRIHLTDKGPGEFRPGTELYEKVKKEFHPRALRRRFYSMKDYDLDSLDRPLHEPYLEKIRSISDSVLTSNPWFNYLVVGLDSTELISVKALPFVRGVSPCRSASYVLGLPDDCSAPFPSLSTPPLEVGNVVRMHDNGVYGQGARIGVIDNGFRWRSMSVLKHLNVEVEYDFIYRRPVTENQDNDVTTQDNHGSLIMSVAAAWHGDSVMGVAPFSTYLLAKTEDMRYERRIEEDLYVEALCWLEKNGADISTSSLGYRNFDSTDDSTPYELLDGKTTYASRAINIATARGMICVTAAGNDGPKGRSISTPADADSAVTIGAISEDGTSAWAPSSWGPSASGRQKPDLSAPGMRVPVKSVNGAIIRASGTSLATPFVAAQFGLLRQLYPDLHTSVLRDAMVRASVYPGKSDSVLGHGAVDIIKAACLLGPSIAEPAIVIVDGRTVALVPIFSMDTVVAELAMLTPDGSRSTNIRGRLIAGQFYLFEFDEALFVNGKARFRILATSIHNTTQALYPRDGSFTEVRQMDVSIPCGMRIPSVIVTVNDEHRGHSSPIIAGNPLTSGIRQFSVMGLLQSPSGMRLINAVSAQSSDVEILGHDAKQTTVMSASTLAPGAWILECRLPETLIYLPFVVI